MDKVSFVNASSPKLHPVSACFLFVLSQKTPGNGGLLEASLPKTLKPATLFYIRNLVNFLFLSYSCFQTEDFFVGLSIAYAPGISTVAKGISTVATGIGTVVTGITNESRGRQSCYKEWKRRRCKSMQSGERLFSEVILQQSSCLYFPIITNTILTNTRQY